MRTNSFKRAVLLIRISAAGKIYHDCTKKGNALCGGGKQVRVIRNKGRQAIWPAAERAAQIKSSRLYQELNQYQENGIPLWLNGRPSTSYQIADRVCENTNYMRDYQTDCQNQICGIGFDRIGKDNQQTAHTLAKNNMSKKLKYIKYI